ncbi:sensor histidine kinase [Nonomuraea soli]|uniref:histidine kinase n=1 Tax=Nonomuraea soli TaxID=1032476 RepID=A0A7W0CKG1_9ACTN|nr:sensor histidine kinase [Nonomuraea soli]MBA2892818.1 signal transduction histidine kinase [Nonomuraea soli]
MRKKDLLAAVIVALVQVTLSSAAYLGQKDLPRQAPDLYANVLLLVGPAMLAVRRRYPVAATLVTLLATFLYLWGGYPYGPVFFSPIIMLVALVLDGRRLAAWLIAGSTLITFIVYAWSIGQRDPFHGVWIGTSTMLLMVAAELGRMVRERRRETLRTKEEESRRQASEERLTMAQELHDVLAHNISLIHVQASTALHLIDDHPEQARTALATIKTASKEVLGEMRSVLNVLREGAPRSPTAGLDRLDELVERSGLDVKLTRAGTRPLPPGVERAAYRIVQESLTNAAKHAPGARVTVLLEYGRQLLVQVTSKGGHAPAAVAEEGGGNGIPGMRERAAALGGTFTAGPTDEGFRVTARLPLETTE